MKKQAYTTFPLPVGGKLREDGSKLASSDSVLTGSTSTMNSVHPIDTLLVHQLEDLLHGEKALRARYASLDPTADTAETRLAFSAELSSLKDRTDRLFRLIDAMDPFGAFEFQDSSFQASAVV